MAYTKREEKYKDEFGANYKQRTKESLKAEISYRVRKLNKEFKQFDESFTGINIVKDAIEDANILAGKKNRNKLIQGLDRNRTKESLIRQARELKSIENMDIYTKYGQEKLAERYYKSYETFKENFDFDELTEEEYRNMVEAFGAIGNDIVDRKSSNDFADAYRNASEKGKVKFVDLWKEAVKYSDNKGWNLYDRMEYFKELLRNAGE